jgi:BirA family biotin operon repressor/biotin-[acetyl-CoA-carboxylase] ligase
MRSPPPVPLDALEVLAQAMDHWRGAWEQSGFAAIAEGWTARAHGLGEKCTAHLVGGSIEGVAEGLDIDGALRLRTADGAVRRITAGDVFF